MFLVVFVTLIISIVGLFAQVISLQAVKLYNAQVALMQTMDTWQSAAVSLAIAKPPSNIGGMTGCQMTSAAILSPPVCTNSGNLLVTNNLPNTYGYNFYTVVYQTASPVNIYAITYVTADATGYLILPSGISTGYSTSSLLQQFSNAGPDNLLYGTVTAAGTLTAKLKSGGATTTALSYTIPASIPAGSIAVLSVAQ